MNRFYLKIYKNANNMKTQLVYLIKYDLRGQESSHKAIFVFNKELFLKYIFCLKSNLIMPLYEYQHCEDTE